MLEKESDSNTEAGKSPTKNAAWLERVRQKMLLTNQLFYSKSSRHTRTIYSYIYIIRLIYI